jgi:uncharacterized RDD family membrane protein YckC
MRSLPGNPGKRHHGHYGHYGYTSWIHIMDKAALRHPHEHSPAGFISRAIAFVIDIVVISVAVTAAIALVQSLLGFFTLYGLLGQRVVQSSPFREIVVVVMALIGAGIAIGYPVAFWVLLGQTPGKLLMGVRIARMNGQPLTVRRALLRYLGYWLSAIPLGLGFLWVLVDDQRQGWHDKLADTYVIYDSRSPLSRSTTIAPRPKVAGSPLGPTAPAPGIPQRTSEGKPR